MEKIITVSIIDSGVSENGKTRSSIISSEIDLFKCQMGEFFKMIHIAIAENKKIVIQPAESKSVMVLISGSLLKDQGQIGDTYQ